MEKIQRQLSSIASLPDQKQKLEQYRGALDQIVASKDASAANAFVDHMLSDDVPLVISRQLLQMFAQEIAKLPPEVHQPVSIYALEKIQPRVVSFEEQVTMLRENLADVLEKEEQWSKAAQTLAGIDLDSGNRVVDAAYRLSKSVKIAMLYLEDDDPVNADVFIKKASALIASCKDPALELQYKVCYARIADSKRRFLEAARRYYELSSVEATSLGGLAVDEGELLQALAASITCTFLADAGPQRSRMLHTLYKDERAASLPAYPILEKACLERILQKEEVASFAALLKPHHQAMRPDGTTVLQRAVTQHNLSAASRLYANIGVEQLGSLLGVSDDDAEAVAADMIIDGRLQGSIDQVQRVIYFNDKVEPLLQWDRQIEGLCGQLNDIIDTVAKLGIKITV